MPATTKGSDNALLGPEGPPTLKPPGETTDDQAGLFEELVGAKGGASDAEAKAAEAQVAEEEKEAVELSEEEQAAAEAAEEEGEGEEEVDPLELRIQQLQEEGERERLKFQNIIARQEKREADLTKLLNEQLGKLAPLLEAAEPKEEGPDPDEEPSKFAAWEAKKAREAAERVEKKSEERDAEEKRREAVAAARDAAAEQRGDYAEEHPDYTEAETFYTEAMVRAAKGSPGFQEDKLGSYLEGLELTLLYEANKAGLTFPELIHRKAKAMGFKPSDNGRPAAKAKPAEKPGTSAAEALADKKRKMEDSDTLRNVGSAPAAESKTIKELLSQGDQVYSRTMSILEKKTGLSGEELERAIEAGQVTMADLRR